MAARPARLLSSQAGAVTCPCCPADPKVNPRDYEPRGPSVLQKELETRLLPRTSPTPHLSDWQVSPLRPAGVCLLYLLPRYEQLIVKFLSPGDTQAALSLFC